MSTLIPPDPVKPVAGIFSADRAMIERAAVRLEAVWGPVDYAGPAAVFDRTDYYRAEMGWPLVKRLIAAETLIDPIELAAIKIEAVRIEAELAAAGRRTVNIDPGYLAVDKLVLATGKPAANRIYIGRGVWADLTLVYQFGTFKALPWTYPDYRTDEIFEVLTDIRMKYLHQMRAKEAPG